MTENAMNLTNRHIHLIGWGLAPFGIALAGGWWLGTRWWDNR